MEILRESLREHGYDEIDDLGVVYDMMFPYRKHKRSLDKLSTCIDINRQLKDLCANQNK